MSRKIYEEEILIEDMDFPVKGIGIWDDKKVTVKNTIPGQRVKINIKKKKQKYEGRLVEILEKAPYEINPECHIFPMCGGCSFQNISYKKELELKKNNILKLLSQLNLKDYEFLGIQGSPNIKAYRNKMEFSFGDTGILGELSLGMRKRDSYYEVVNADNCLIIDEDIRKIVTCVRDFFKSSEDTFYHKTKRIGALRHLVVRKAFFTGEILINLVTTSELKSALKDFTKLLLSLKLDGNIVGVLHTINDSVADAVKADKIEILFGRDYFMEKLLDLDFKISAFSFFQTNSRGAEILYSIIKKFAGNINGSVIFDLYCGTGTIAQIISKNAKKVIGIELVEEAVIAARANAVLNRINNCTFIAGDVLKVIENVSEKPDMIIIDPPREGIHPKAIGKIIMFNVEKIIYVSCKPSSMIRDLNIFLENNYKIEKIECLDMFPRTPHVETVCLLTRKPQ